MDPTDGVPSRTLSSLSIESGAVLRPDLMTRGTSLARRALALSALFGGIGLGVVAAGSGGGQWLLAGSLVVLIGGLVPILRASRHPPVGINPVAPASRGALPTISVLVAGRDEATVLPHLMADLGAQDHRDELGAPRFEVIVIDDRSSDGTAGVVLEAADAAGIGKIVRVVRREGEHLSDGKGAALTAAQPETCTGDVIVVLDADARIGSDYLRRVATYVACGVPALTSRRRIHDAHVSALTALQADEQTQDGALQRGRWASGGCSEFRGNGLAIRRDLLAAVGGWDAAPLTEDLDLSSRLAARQGLTVALALDLEVWEEPVHTWRALWPQRLRWSEGAITRLIEQGPSVVGSPLLPVRARWDFAAYGLQLMAPPLILGALVGAVATGLAGLAAALIGMYLAAGGILGFDALRWESTPAGTPLSASDRIVRSVRVALFSLIWLIAVPAALWRLGTRRGRVRFDKSTHAGRGIHRAER